MLRSAGLNLRLYRKLLPSASADENSSYDQKNYNTCIFCFIIIAVDYLCHESSHIDECVSQCPVKEKRKFNMPVLLTGKVCLKKKKKQQDIY